MLQITRQSLIVGLCSFCLLFLPWANRGHGQTVQQSKGTPVLDPTSVLAAKARVQSGEFQPIDIEKIARAGEVDAIPSLRTVFDSSKDPNVKAKIASALVRLGEKDNNYWNYLVGRAMGAIQSDIPNFYNYDLQGKTTGGPSEALVAWANGHNVSIEVASQDALFLYWGDVAQLAVTGDPRAIPLLQKGLLARDYMIEYASAEGLAKIQDVASIPLIVKACEGAPAEAAATIAQSLVYFDDPAAQKAVDTFMPRDMARIYRGKRAKGDGPFD